MGIIPNSSVFLICLLGSFMFLSLGIGMISGSFGVGFLSFGIMLLATVVATI